MPTIAAVDDDSSALGLIKEAFEAEGFGVLLYLSGLRALEEFDSRSPDAVITNIRTRGMDGLELLRRLRQKSDVPVIFLTSRADEKDELVGLRMGADDFIRKPFSPNVLVERIRAILRRSRPIQQAGSIRHEQGSQNVIERGHLRMDKDRYTCAWKGRVVDLTATEFHLLEGLAIRPGTTKDRMALRELIYEDEPIDDRMIDSHIKRLRKKFRSVDETFDEIKSLYGVGYRFGRE